MTRTHRNTHSAPGGGGGKTHGSAQQRRSHISRTLSKLLRHRAEDERIPITKEGWVKVTDLLAWRGLKNLSSPGSSVDLEDVIDVVRDDGLHGKGRFGLRYLGDVSAIGEGASDHEADPTNDKSQISEELSAVAVTTSTSKNSPETLIAISQHEKNPNESASAFLIRATQGHSIKAVEFEGLLTPITLDDPSSIPDTVVHGTFYGAWNRILSSGGLSPMSRNMVHFASGPTLAEVLPVTPTSTALSDTADLDLIGHTPEATAAAAEDERPNQPSTTDTKPRALNEKKVEEILSQNKVISGMRRDAQVLIYIDIKRLLNDVQKNGWDMKWWRSDNGVILTEGVTIPISSSHVDTKNEGDENENENNNKNNRHRNKSKPNSNTNPKVVPSSYFQAVVEIKAGLGLLFEAAAQSGSGGATGENDEVVQGRVVKDLPPALNGKAMPRGKGFVNRNR